MGEPWNLLDASERRTLLRHCDPEHLKAKFGLTDSDIKMGSALSSEDTAQRTGEHAYEEFLRTEYNNIAAAHFNTGTAITRFFQFYLVIVSLPITLLGVTLNVSQQTLDLDSIVGTRLGLLLAVFFLVIALVGFCMMVYVANLRLDALLYARVVNGIRRYFTDRSGLDLAEELVVRALPRSTQLPRYQNFAFFGPVILAFALFNGLYVATASWLASVTFVPPLLAAYVFICLHFLVYWSLTWYREHGYLWSNTIGIDIDGVISNHRTTFCDVLKKKTNKTVEPGDITEIPVRRCENLGVSKEDELRVFNSPEYWQDLAVQEAAAENINQLGTKYGLRVFVFTYRPWPNFGDLPVDMREEYQSSWKLGSRWRLRGIPIRRLTAEWLKRKNIQWDRLFVERSKAGTQEIWRRSKNRVVVAQRKAIRFFVEDDVSNAKRLANICDIVFLYDQPYNRVPDADLPRNVTRVTSWNHLDEELSRLLG